MAVESPIIVFYLEFNHVGYVLLEFRRVVPLEFNNFLMVFHSSFLKLWFVEKNCSVVISTCAAFFEEVVEKRFGPVSFVIQGLSILSKAMRSGSRHHAATISRFMLRPVILGCGRCLDEAFSGTGFLGQ